MAQNPHADVRGLQLAFALLTPHRVTVKAVGMDFPNVAPVSPFKLCGGGVTLNSENQVIVVRHLHSATDEIKTMCSGAIGRTGCRRVCTTVGTRLAGAIAHTVPISRSQFAKLVPGRAGRVRGHMVRPTL